MLTIDGSFGEGGGQILRSSLALSLISGTPFRITNIRGNRKKPGLLRQHLTGVRAAAILGSAEVRGAELRSSELTFKPGAIKGGSFEFAVGTAGSAGLVIQAVLPALIHAGVEVELVVKGGTHNPSSPPAPFLMHTFMPLLRRMGVDIELSLDRAGFYPAGGGQYTLKLKPSTVKPLELLERGEVGRIEAYAELANLPRRIGRAELETVCQIMQIDRRQSKPVVVQSDGPGNALWLRVEAEHITAVFCSFGRKGVRSEQVAVDVCEEAGRWLEGGWPVGEHLADQLLIPLALAKAGSFRTGPLSLHTKTNIEVIERFLGTKFSTEEFAQGTVVSVG